MRALGVVACRAWIALAVVALTLVAVAPVTLARTPSAGDGSTADHAEFEALAGPFESIEALSEACIGCHNAARDQIAATVHWRWETDADSGKRHVANGLFGALGANAKGCSACHIGFQNGDQLPDFDAPGPVDCLVCHDTTGKYAYERDHRPGATCTACHDDRRKRDRRAKRERADLAAVARGVGPTSRATCGGCHFYADGGDGVKHGDLDSSLLAPARSLDVHMSPDGADFSCTTCHRTRAHALDGSRYSAPADDHAGALGVARCATCHAAEDTHEPALARHARRIACQTCHIPTFARGGVATRTRWDWSSAGERGRKGRVLTRKDEAERVVYTTQKGSFEWDENVVPTYAWIGGGVAFVRPGEAAPDGEPLALTRFPDTARGTGARLHPVKVLRSRQAFDAGARRIVPVQLTGRARGAYWTSYDWGRALEAGARQSEIEFSGEPGFVETVTSLPLNHTVAPAGDALGCTDCHTRAGRIDAVEGVYVPGRDRSATLDQLGIGLAAACIGGVGLHGLGRMLAALARRRRKRS